MPTEIPSSITTPDRVETRLGTLRFFDGFPDDATARTLYDHLDFLRGVEVFLTTLPAAAGAMLCIGARSQGPDNQTALVSESRVDSRSLFLNANTDTVYAYASLDTRAGPLVIEVPPNVLGAIDDVWSRFVADLGFVGPDQGSGGKYLLVPPDYSGAVPADHYVVRSRTWSHYLFIRGFVSDGDPKPVAQAIEQRYRVYPLDQAANPPAMRFLNLSGMPIDTIYPNDASYFDLIARVVHDEPLEAVDPETRGLLASIGIRKDAPFAPDERMRRILEEAAAVGNATARALAFNPRNPETFVYRDSAWKRLLVGQDYRFSPGDVLDPDARTLFFHLTLGMSPSFTEKRVGQGSQYVWTDRDAAGRYLDGANTYRLHLPPGIPAKDFWSLVVYDPQSRSLLQTDQLVPGVGSAEPGLVVNPDSSVDVHFGPNPPDGQQGNWIRTIPGKGWFTMFRLYGPLEPWFDQTWRPGEIERVAEAVSERERPPTDADWSSPPTPV